MIRLKILPVAFLILSAFVVVPKSSAEDAVKVMRCFDGVMIDGQYMVVNICGEHLHPEKQVNEEDEYAEWGCGAESDGSD